MAELVPAADDAAADAGKTAVVPNFAATEAVSLAWSSDDDNIVPDDIVQNEAIADDAIHNDVHEVSPGEVHNEPTAARQSWRSTWGGAAALLMVGLGLAGMIVLAHWALTTGQSPTNAAQPASATAPATPKEGARAAPTAPAATSAPSTAPPSIASTPDQDNEYVQTLNDRGLSFGNPGAAVYNGKLVCENIRLGMTVPEVVAAFRASSPALGDHADAYVAISVRTYCPQNRDLLPAG